MGAADEIRIAAPAVLTGILVLLQGGYYPGAVCVIGLVCTLAFTAIALVRRWKPAISWTSACLFALGLLYAASAVAHGATLTMLLEAASWFAVAGLSLWCAPRSPAEKGRSLDDMAVVGVVLAAMGILMFAGILPIEGTVSSGRLMFTFQYANTAGLFFAVIAILCLSSRRTWLRAACLVPAAALALTQSGGALLVFAIALLVFSIRWARAAKPSFVLVIAVIAVVAIACIAVAVLFQGRIAQAVQTLIERFVQMSDALALLGGSPVLGIGPDQWQIFYPQVQTAQYRAADVHCSYLQVALDGGVLALVVLVAFLAVGIFRLARAGDFAACLCAGMVAAHALVDFDFQFAAVMMLAAVLLAQPSEPAEERLSSRMRAVAVWMVAACSIIASCGGVYLDMRAGALQTAAVRGDAGQAASILDSAGYLRDDPLMRLQAVRAYYAVGDLDAVVDATGEAAIENLAWYRMLAQYGLGDTDAALETMSGVLLAHPYDVELFEAALSFIEDNEPGPAFEDAYNEAADRANGLLASGHAAWLSGQERIEVL